MEYIIEYFSAMKKKEILPFATAWMDLESIMLSELSLSEKDKSIWFYLYVETNVVESWLLFIPSCVG